MVPVYDNDKSEHEIRGSVDILQTHPGTSKVNVTIPLRVPLLGGREGYVPSIARILGCQSLFKVELAGLSPWSRYHVRVKGAPAVAFAVMSPNLKPMEGATQKPNLSSEFKHSSALMR